MMNSEETKKKLKLERIEICLNCRKLSECEDVGKYEECESFDEVKDEAWVIRKI